MNASQFEALRAEGYHRIPLVAEVFADLDTPLSLYLKLAAGQPFSYLLESVVGGERFGRYSFIGLPAKRRLQVWIEPGCTRTEVIEAGDVVEVDRGDPLAFIEAYQARLKVYVPEGMPRFCGGLAGYFGHDTVRLIEHKLASVHKSGGLGTPDILLLETEELAVIDNLRGKLSLMVYAHAQEPGAFEAASQRLESLMARLQMPAVVPVAKAQPPQTAQRPFAKADYLCAAQRCKDLIAAGDMMQVQIGQRIAKPFNAPPLSLYRALRTLNPSPYMYYYDMGDFQIVGASPEILVRQESVEQGGSKVTIRPIAGTRPRGSTVEEDKALEAELLADPKERAEHLMLIDLARNDVGRIAQVGSVQVTQAFEIERYSHVMHIVSHVEGRLLPGLTNLDVLKATFPAGTLTGAPKIRAMEVIDELEPVARSVYGGAVGYLSFAGDMDVAIAIRTGVVKGGMLYVQASAGIVADSVPEAEWAETEAKARAVLRAAERVEDGL